MKIGNVKGKFGENSGLIDSGKESTMFMDIVLFDVFDQHKMTSPIDMKKKKHGFSHYIVLECEHTECDWKYCFHILRKNKGHHLK
jgi:hypothetical protein